MERSLPYLLIVLLLIGGWNESFKARFDRLIGRNQEPSTEEVSTEAPAAIPAATPVSALKPTPRPTAKVTPTPTVAPATQSGVPFFNDPSYHNPLDHPTPKIKH